MIDELKSIELVEKVGGRFKLTALIQKRLMELMTQILSGRDDRFKDWLFHVL